VRSKNDLLIYAGILMVGMVISNLIIWSDVKKYVLSFEMDTSAFSGIFFASLILFLPTSAITVYTDIIRTFLGIVTTKRYVAFYVQADMLIKVIFSLITSLGTVIMPHVSNLISKGKFIQVKKLISKSFFIMTLTSLPITVLVFALSDNFIRLFLGNNFLPTSQLLKINAISIIFSAWANVLGIQYLLPIGRVKDYTLSITLPALSIFVTAPIFFKLFGVAGVMYSIVLIQISVFIIELIY
ncbi:oligosaccharide flippase family protein, partial [Leuconostoc mesenteroides]